MVDWVCDSCSFDNNDLLEHCEMCDSPRVIHQSEMWVCGVCEYGFNDRVEDIKCLMCESNNPEVPVETRPLIRRYLHCDWHRNGHGCPNAFVEIMKDNIVIYRNCLDSDLQMLLLEDCKLKLNRVVLGGMDGVDKPGPTHCFNYHTGWVPGKTEDKQEGDPDCLQLASNLHANLVSELKDEIAQLNQNQPDELLHIPDRFVAQSLLGRQYTLDNGLGMHFDPPQLNWVFIISIGADTRFELFNIDGTTQDVVLRSGDAIFFNGSKIKHGIKEFISDTQPDWWSEPDYQRVGLQMRGYKAPGL